jgi:hypothetical protein
MHHQLWNTELTQTVVENRVQDAKYLDSEVHKLPSSDLKIVYFVHASKLADAFSFYPHVMKVRGWYCCTQEDWRGISVSYEEKWTQQNILSCFRQMFDYATDASFHIR